MIFQHWNDLENETFKKFNIFQIPNLFFKKIEIIFENYFINLFSNIWVKFF